MIVDETDATPMLPMPQPVLVPLASPSCGQVCTALAAAQGEFETPRRTKEATVRGQTKAGGSYDYKYKYAPLEEIISSVKDALAKNGLFRQQYLVTKDGIPLIRTIIWHSSGEWIASDYPIHQSRDGAQGFAAGVTYARRYGLSLALGIAPEDDDDATEGDAKIADTRASVKRMPPPPAANVMAPNGTSPHDASAESERIMGLDRSLEAAALKGSAELEKAFLAFANSDRAILKAALERRHKPAAALADAKLAEKVQP